MGNGKYQAAKQLIEFTCFGCGGVKLVDPTKEDQVTAVKNGLNVVTSDNTQYWFHNAECCKIHVHKLNRSSLEVIGQ